jgi:hypothetical protein
MKKALKRKGIYIVTIIFVLQAIITVFSLVSGEESIVISDAVLDAVRMQDPENFERNISNYRNLLVDQDVHDEFKQKIEQLVLEGKPLPEILCAYRFLYDQYGTWPDLEQMLEKRLSGFLWEDVFGWYIQEQPAFEPRNFEFGYLERLIEIYRLSPDDVMIADRVAARLSRPFEEIIEYRISRMEWKDAKAQLSILNSQQKLPKVSITPDELKKYTADGKITEDEVVEALVLAHHLDLKGETVINMFKGGYTVERIYAQTLTALYLD